jgi:DNA polymerase III subunit beta
MQFTIPVDSIKALLVAAAKNDVRYYLNGICIDVRGTDAVAVATDGHMLLALPLERAEGDESPLVSGHYIIARDALDKLKAPVKGGHVTLSIDAAAQSLTIIGWGSTTTTKLVEGCFPDWRRVIPHTVSGLVSQFDADLVAAFGKINKLLGSKYSPAIAHNGGENGDGAAARVMLTGDAVGVIMPMRYDRIKSVDVPAWADFAPAATAAAA